MKNKYFVISFCILLLLASLVISSLVYKDYYDKELLDLFSAASKADNDESEKTVVAIIGDKKIYRENIDMVKASEALSNKQKEEYAQQNGLPVPKASESSEEEILKQLIRQNVIYQQAENDGVLPSYEDAYSMAEENYNIIMELNNENTEFLKDYMEALNIDENEYIKRSAESNRFLMAQNNLYKKFIEGKSGTDEELKAAFEIYVDELVEKADIEYK